MQQVWDGVEENISLCIHHFSIPSPYLWKTAGNDCNCVARTIKIIIKNLFKVKTTVLKLLLKVSSVKFNYDAKML